MSGSKSGKNKKVVVQSLPHFKGSVAIVANPAQIEALSSALSSFAHHPISILLIEPTDEQLANPLISDLIAKGKLISLKADQLSGNTFDFIVPATYKPDLIVSQVKFANALFHHAIPEGAYAIGALGRKKSDSLTTRTVNYLSTLGPRFFTGINSHNGHLGLTAVPGKLFATLYTGGLRNGTEFIKASVSLGYNAEDIEIEFPKSYNSSSKIISNVARGKILALKFWILCFFRLPKIVPEKGEWKYSKSIFFCIALITLVYMFAISRDYNITWDEPTQNTFSKDVVKYYTSFGSDTSIWNYSAPGHQDYLVNNYYGMSIDVLAAGINDVFGIENEYVVRHILITITGFLAILFAALLAASLAGWHAATLTVLAMVFSPSFFGHCFNNAKDMPFAAGFIMSIYFMVKLLREMPKPKVQTKLMLAISMGFALSIRAGGLLLFGYFFALLAGYFIFFDNKNRTLFQRLKPLLILFLSIVVTAYILGILSWPYALRDPLTGAFTALKEFEKFSFLTYYELFEGVRIYQKPWYYIPKLIGITAPVVVLAGTGLYLLLSPLKWKKEWMVYTFVTVATAFPLLYLFYKNSYVYNGWRHFLFIYPSIVALSVIGFYWLCSLVKLKRATLAVSIIIIAGLVMPAIFSIQNHPYQYLYFNELTGGIKGANGNYELDYWNQSPRQVFHHLINRYPEVLKGDQRVSSNNIQESLITFNPKGKKVKYKWTREYEWSHDDYAYAIWTTRTLDKNQILGKFWPPKGTIYEEKVDGVTIAVLVKAQNNFAARGYDYLRKRNADSARYFYEKAIAYNPVDEEYYRGLGNAYKAKGLNDSAIHCFNTAIRLRNGNYEAYNALGEIYLNKAVANPAAIDKTSMNKAREFFSLAVKNKQNLPSTYYYLGEIYLNENDGEQAKNYFNQTIKYNPNIAQAYNGLGKAQLMIGEGDSAINNFYIATQIDKKYPEPFYYLYTELEKRGQTKEAEQFKMQYMQLTGQMAP